MVQPISHPSCDILTLFAPHQLGCKLLHITQNVIQQLADFSTYSNEVWKMTQKIVPQIPKSLYPHSCDKFWTIWSTEITRDSLWLTESLRITRFFRIIWNRCYYLNINVLSLFQWAITEVNSNISINVKSSTADRCTYICMYLEHHALAHCLDSIKSQKWRICSMQFSNTLNYVMS